MFALPLLLFIPLVALTGDQVVEIIRNAPAIIAALASLVLAIKARRDARSARQSAEAAHERATEAAREQLTFALKRAVLEAKLPPLPHREGGAS